MGNILIVATTSYAGMGPYVSEIVNTFSDQEPVYFLFHDYEDNFFRKNIKESLHHNSLFVRQSNSAWDKLRYMFTGKLGYEQEIIRFCKRKEIDVVHFINGLGTLQLNRKLESMGIKVICTIHDLHPHEANKAPHKMLRHHIIYARLWCIVKQMRYLVTNSGHQVDELRSLFPGKDIFFHDFPSLVTNEIKSGKDIPQELSTLKRPYILFFGRIEEYKGIRLLVEAFNKSFQLSQNYILVIAGKGELSVSAKMQQNIIFINRYIKDSEIKYLYEHAACVAYPYMSATQSGVLSLSSYFQTPVLASDVPFFKSAINEGKMGYLFQSGNTEDLERQLVRLLDGDTAEIKENAKAYYQRHYQQDMIRLQLKNIYQSIDR